MKRKVYKYLSIIIPVYNEEKTIRQTIENITKVHLGLKKEIIVVDDGSTDGTRKILQTIKKSQQLVVIHRQKNEGKGAAVKMGIQRSYGDLVLVQDADLEYSPSDYPLIIEPFLEKGDQPEECSRYALSRA